MRRSSRQQLQSLGGSVVEGKENAASYRAPGSKPNNNNKLTYNKTPFAFSVANPNLFNNNKNKNSNNKNSNNNNNNDAKEQKEIKGLKGSKGSKESKEQKELKGLKELTESTTNLALRDITNKTPYLKNNHKTFKFTSAKEKDNLEVIPEIEYCPPPTREIPYEPIDEELKVDFKFLEQPPSAESYEFDNIKVQNEYGKY